MDDKPGHKRKIFLPCFGLHKHMALHIFAGLIMGNTSLPHCFINLADELLPEVGAAPVGLGPGHIHPRPLPASAAPAAPRSSPPPLPDTAAWKPLASTSCAPKAGGK